MKKLNIIVMDLAGMLLIAGALLKVHQVLTEPILSAGFFESWLFFVIQIPLELALGIWLMSRLFTKGAWLLGMLSYGGFIFVTLHKVLSGAESCGCFGMVKVDPIITLYFIDIPGCLLLAIFRPRGKKFFPPPWPGWEHFLGVATPSFIFVVTITLIIAFNEVPRLSAGLVEHTPKNKITRPQPNKVEPDTPDPCVTTTDNGKSDNQTDNAQSDNHLEEPPELFAWLKDIDIAESLKSDIVIILFYHYDCPDCAELIPMYEETNREFSGNEDAIRFVFIEIPPIGPDEKSPIPKDTLCLVGKLDPKKDWPVQSPFVVALWDGVLVEKWEEGQSPEPNEVLDTIFAEN
jgi:thiol-disulfide isomerase/thioredoxin